MAVYLSPGVFPVEIDLSVIPAAVGALTPAFIGTANKGPIQTPTFVSTSQQFIDVFGNPFPESYLGYAVLAYFEQGARAWILRVGVECSASQPEALSSICIDTSGARGNGWGRISVFSGIDNGRICSRVISTDAPLSFHPALLAFTGYNDILVDPSVGACNAALLFTDVDGYTGSINDAYTVILTSDPSASVGSTITGATYEVIRNSDGDTVLMGTLQESLVPYQSYPITLPDDNIEFYIQISKNTEGNYVPLGNNDSFTFTAVPDNRFFSFSVGDGTSPSYMGESAVLTMPTAIYTTAIDFATEVNALITAYDAGGKSYGTIEYLAVAEDDGTCCIQTITPGYKIQLINNNPNESGYNIEGWALEIGQVLYAYDIPRSFLISTIPGPYNIGTDNNRISISDLSSTVTTEVDFSLIVGTGITSAALASSIDLGSYYLGKKYWQSYAMLIPGGETQVVIESTSDNMFDQLLLNADTSHYKTLRFAATLGYNYPYTANYRVYVDDRVELPAAGTITPNQPLSCEQDPGSAQCTVDSDYFANIVGWFVAVSPGTWINGYKLTLSPLAVNASKGITAGRFTILIENAAGLAVDQVENVSFDITDDRYVANVINPGSELGGANGDAYINWIPRPSFLNNDPTSPSGNPYEVRVPGPINRSLFTGAADGIPVDPIYSSELDAATIGNPADESGLYAFQNAELYDISLLLTPGSSSGAVIGQALQLCQSRGDVLYLVDPPFGLRAQQVVDWHNGMLYSDLSQAINSSYGALYFPWLEIFDQFSSNNIFIPPSGHVSSAYAYTAQVAETWFAPAGTRRGHLLTPIDIEVNLTQGERDLLYGSGNAVNPIVNFPQDGITIWGQRTLQRDQSALDRVNVRMLLIYIKKNAVQFLRQFVFEPNDPITRANIVNVSNNFLADVAARRGLTAYNVVCDATNNTPERIDANELYVAYFLKPTRAAEFIVLDLVILRTDASFSAAEVLQAGGVTTVNA